MHHKVATPPTLPFGGGGATAGSKGKQPNLEALEGPHRRPLVVLHGARPLYNNWSLVRGNRGKVTVELGLSEAEKITSLLFGLPCTHPIARVDGVWIGCKLSRFNTQKTIQRKNEICLSFLFRILGFPPSYSNGGAHSYPTIAQPIKVPLLARCTAR